MLHEWAHYRYGVFEEYGYPDLEYDLEIERFSHFFRNTKGHLQVTSCNDTEIIGQLVST